jgi:hypothetical protein
MEKRPISDVLDEEGATTTSGLSRKKSKKATDPTTTTKRVSSTPDWHDKLSLDVFLLVLDYVCSEMLFSILANV